MHWCSIGDKRCLHSLRNVNISFTRPHCLIVHNIPIAFFYCGPGSSVGIATELRPGRSGIEFRWGRVFAPVQTGRGAYPASCKMGTGTGQFLTHSSTFRCQDLSRRCGCTGTWRRKWERLKAGESNGKLPPRTCPGCSVPQPYRSHDWSLVPASPASKAEY